MANINVNLVMQIRCLLMHLADGITSPYMYQYVIEFKCYSNICNDMSVIVNQWAITTYTLPLLPHSASISNCCHSEHVLRVFIKYVHVGAYTYSLVGDIRVSFVDLYSYVAAAITDTQCAPLTINASPATHAMRRLNACVRTHTITAASIGFSTGLGYLFVLRHSHTTQWLISGASSLALCGGHH